MTVLQSGRWAIELCMPNLAATLRAFESRNYRLFVSGQGVSLIGTWMTRLATNWLVYRLTGSAVLLGITGFASQIPAFVLGPIAGVWLDRWNRHRVVVILQTVSMLQSFALAALALSGIITVWEIVALSLVQGLHDRQQRPRLGNLRKSALTPIRHGATTARPPTRTGSRCAALGDNSGPKFRLILQNDCRLAITGGKRRTAD